MTLTEQAQNLADLMGSPYWVVTPMDGDPYIANRSSQIQPDYFSIETFLPGKASTTEQCDASHPSKCHDWDATISSILESRWMKGDLPIRSVEIASAIRCPAHVASKIMKKHGWQRRRNGAVRGYWPPGVIG